MRKPSYTFVSGMDKTKLNVLLDCWVMRDIPQAEIYKLMKLFFKIQPNPHTLQSYVRSARLRMRDKPFKDNLARWHKEIEDRVETQTDEEIELEELYHKGDKYKALKVSKC